VPNNTRQNICRTTPLLSRDALAWTTLAGGAKYIYQTPSQAHSPPGQRVPWRRHVKNARVRHFAPLSRSSADILYRRRGVYSWPVAGRPTSRRVVIYVARRKRRRARALRSSAFRTNERSRAYDSTRSSARFPSVRGRARMCTHRKSATRSRPTRAAAAATCERSDVYCIYYTSYNIT